MHWLRLDRYYIGDDPVNEATMAVMPMMCQHCEYAPCESVCPVAATTHSPDGLNEMTYNRCIGTRYCSNNCPYKIRRYNWFNWNKTLPAEDADAAQPPRDPRFRGVMEKCTWCIHRIRNANYYAHLENRKIADGEVQTACQQACPSDAIVFGDLTDPDSRVSQMKRTARRYEVLEEYNIKPRLSYLARLSNPNPRLAGGPREPAGTPAPEPPSPPRVPGPTPAERPPEAS
jgi:Fe-S-cluster-containing dehydrogenase component